MPTMIDILDRQFAAIGARARLVAPDETGRVALDVRVGRSGEFFELRVPVAARTAVLNVDKPGRHMLLLVSMPGEKSRFLCGHDDRHWFVAAIPESAPGVVNVARAKEALQPESVRNIASRLTRSQRRRRRTRAFSRQGEWFFVPTPDFSPDPATVLRNERLSRGRGKFHLMQFAARRGGETVYVSRANPTGLTQTEFDALAPEVRRRESWSRMTQGASVFAVGRIKHPDHPTLVLKGWHQVFMNTENRAIAMRNVAFLD